MATEGVTRSDLEQMFENQALLFTKEIGRVEENMDRSFAQVYDEIAELRATVDRIDRRDSKIYRRSSKKPLLLKNISG